MRPPTYPFPWGGATSQRTGNERCGGTHRSTRACRRQNRCNSDPPTPPRCAGAVDTFLPPSAADHSMCQGPADYSEMDLLQRDGFTTHACKGVSGIGVYPHDICTRIDHAHACMQMGKVQHKVCACNMTATAPATAQTATGDQHMWSEPSCYTILTVRS